MFHTWAIVKISILHLPATSLLPGALLHKGLGVLGNNWTSIVAGCGRMPRLPPVLHTLFRSWAIPIYITPDEDTPQQLGRGDCQNKQVISLEHLVLSANLITAFIFLERNRYHCKQQFALAAQYGRVKGLKLKATWHTSREQQLDFTMQQENMAPSPPYLQRYEILAISGEKRNAVLGCPELRYRHRGDWRIPLTNMKTSQQRTESNLSSFGS